MDIHNLLSVLHDQTRVQLRHRRAGHRQPAIRHHAGCDVCLDLVHHYRHMQCHWCNSQRRTAHWCRTFLEGMSLEFTLTITFDDTPLQRPYIRQRKKRTLTHPSRPSSPSSSNASATPSSSTTSRQPSTASTHTMSSGCARLRTLLFAI